MNNGEAALTLDAARALDGTDPLRQFRDEFLFPAGPDGKPVRYFCGNSLGLQPRGVRAAVEQELDDWATHGVEGHFQAKHPWYRYHEAFRAPLSRLVGAGEHEVVLMNSLTTNLHLLWISFYRPTQQRYRIVMEHPVFPSDLYAAQTQIRYHGFDPKDALIQVGPRDGESLVREEDLIEVLEREGDSVALLWMAGVSFYTGQRFPMARLTEAAHEVGAYAGFDLAHAAGNVPLRLHDDEVDFAVWCSYKYLNGGPGAMGGAFVHERHATDTRLPRFGGWWGNDPDTRFRMHLESTFQPVPTADAWQLSNPSILSMAPVRASLELFDRAGVENLRTKSVQLTGYLERLLRARCADRVEIVTPSEPEARGCQLSLRFPQGAGHVQAELQSRGIICDYRKPDMLRAAPVPLYNAFEDVWHLVDGIVQAGEG